MRALGVACAVALLAGCEVERPLAFRRGEPPVTSVQTSWIGNSYGGAGRRWMPRVISAVHATPDGTVFALGEDTQVEWLSDTVTMKGGEIIGELANLTSSGRRPGAAIVGNDRHLFVAMRQGETDDGAPPDYPAKGTVWHCVRRYDHRGLPAPFAGGRGYDGSMLVVGTTHPVKALAISPTKLYVAAGQAITVYELETLTLERTFPVPAPEAMAADRAGTLFIVDGAKEGGIGRYGPTGALLPGRITDAGTPRALAVDPEGRLLVADAGPRQQLLVYSTQEPAPRLLRTLGGEGGLAAAGGTDVRPDRFYGLTGVTTDAGGNVYAAMNLGRTYGARLVALSSQGQPSWELSSLVSFDGAAIDPSSDGLEVYTKLGRFRLDFARAPGKQARLISFTADWLRFPEPSQGPAQGALVRIGARRFLVDRVSGTPGDLRMKRFLPGGDLAVAAVQLGIRGDSTPQRVRGFGAWYWRDGNGDGIRQEEEYEGFDAAPSWGGWIDEQGDIWRTMEKSGIDHFPLASVDDNGVPLHHMADRRRLPMPAPFQRIQQFVYRADEDVAYVVGYTADHPNPYGDAEWTAIGTELIRYDGWKGNRRVRWRLPLLLDPNVGHRPCCFAVAGNRVFLMYVNDEAVYLADAETGARLGKFRAGPEVASWLGTSRAGAPALAAFQRLSGEYLLFATDPAHSKLTLFRVPPDHRAE